MKFYFVLIAFLVTNFCVYGSDKCDNIGNHIFDSATIMNMSNFLNKEKITVLHEDIHMLERQDFVLLREKLKSDGVVNIDSDYEKVCDLIVKNVDKNTLWYIQSVENYKGEGMPYVKVTVCPSIYSLYRHEFNKDSILFLNFSFSVSYINDPRGHLTDKKVISFGCGFSHP